MDSASRNRKARSVPSASSRLVRVVARLQSGVVMPAVFPLPLDGILSAAARKRTLGDRYWQGPQTVARGDVLELRRTGKRVSGRDEFFRQPPMPLSLWDRDLKNQSVFLASCASPVGASVDDVRWWHKRFDEQRMDGRVDKIPANTETGIFKAFRVPEVATVCTALEWWAMGDPDGIRSLVADVDAIGKKAAQGEGVVLGWDVEDHGPTGGRLIDNGGGWEPSPATERVMWGDDGLIARPVPHRGCAALGLDPTATDRLPHQIRAPYWRPPQTGSDGFRREPREVIAPWTQHP